jgi:hypothetical protein
MIISGSGRCFWAKNTLCLRDSTRLGRVLILKRGSASRPSGQWREDDFDVLEDRSVVGRIFCLDAAGPQALRGCGLQAATARSAPQRTATRRRARRRCKRLPGVGIKKSDAGVVAIYTARGAKPMTW